MQDVCWLNIRDSDVVPYFRKIAKDWVELYSDSGVGDNDEDPLIIYEALIDGAAPFAWGLILETIAQDDKGHSLPMLIAGPLQSFITRQGDEWIDMIAAQAETNPRLKWALGAIVKPNCSTVVWQRLKAVRGIEWSPFSENPPPYPGAS
jgi:hypothetical protein